MKVQQANPVVRTYRWLKSPPKEPNSRGTTILMWGLIAGTCAFVIAEDREADDRDKRETEEINARLALQVLDRAHDICIQRVQGRDDVRAVFIDLYNFVGEIGVEPKEVEEL